MKMTSTPQSLFRNHRLLASTAAVVTCLLFTGCPSGQQQANATSGNQGKVVIKGSNTVGEELAPGLITAYKKDHPNAAFELESKGTGYGFGNLLGGGCDIAAASRAANETEQKLARDRGIEMNEHVIGSYSVAIVVNSANTTASLTKEQVRDIFTGTVKNWKEVGGPDAPIALYVRDPISGTHLGFKELAMENKPYAAEIKPLKSYAEIVKAVAQDPNGIGYSSIQLATTAGVKGVSIGDVAPTPESVNKNKYPYTRLLHLYTKKGGESSETTDFLKFVQSKQGEEVKNQLGVVPQP